MNLSPSLLSLGCLLGLANIVLAGSPASPPFSGLLADTTQETTPTPSARNSPPPWVRSLKGNYAHQFDADLEQGGSFSVDRSSIDLGLTRLFDTDHLLGLSLSYGSHAYDFEGMPTNLWDDVQTLGLSAPVLWKLNDRWKLFALTSVRSQIEKEADFSDGLGAGFLGAFSYKFSDRLSLGPGIGLSTALEDDLSVFPIFMLKWQLSDSLLLETGPGYATAQGPALNLVWQASDDWSLTLGAQYQKLRFRLNDEGPAPGGVGEEKGGAAYLTLSYAPNPGIKASLFGGVKFAGSLSIDDANGQEIYESDHDATPFIGTSLQVRF